MIKVTVFAGDGKFLEIPHSEAGAYTVQDGILHLYRYSHGDYIISYAPGAWLRVESIIVNETNST
jgi:hypothetical protein